MDIQQVIVIVLDSVGIGDAPDAREYGDFGSNTLGNIAQAVGGLHLPNLEKLGLGNLGNFLGIPETDHAEGAYGRLTEVSAGKDTTTGHWELAGVPMWKPFPTFPNGFPVDFMAEFKRRTGRAWLGNYPASGTMILDELGEEHMSSGAWIVYTSGDSVFQIAAHEGIIPLQELYQACQTAREMLVGDLEVARVIARPFIGQPGAFRRTENRRDFSLQPPADTILDILNKAGLMVAGVGKIEDIFAHRGLSDSNHSGNNQAGVDGTIEFIRTRRRGLIFTNLVDFDALYGHRNDPAGYAAALRAFDERLPEVLAAMAGQDILFITADHGNDPTTPSTDHSRERVPLLAAGALVKPNTDLGTRATYADLAATIAALFAVEKPAYGTDFSALLLG